MVKRRILSITLLNLKIVYELFINKTGITIKRLAENLKIDYKNIYNAVDFLFNNGIIKKEKIGNYNICKLNYDNEEVTGYLKWHNALIKIKDFKRKHNIEYSIIMETINKLKKTSPFFICAVFGSYSKSEEKEGSDIDLLFLGSTNTPALKNVLNKINIPYQKKFHIVEQNIHNFIKDLKSKDKLSIAVEIYKEAPIIFYGDDIFFRMIAEVKKEW